MRSQDGYVVNEWVYDPTAPIPIWVVRTFHKLGSEQKLESLNFGTAYPGDTICRLEKAKLLWVEKKDPKWRMTDGTNGHHWGFWNQDDFQCCRMCGQIRRADDKNPQCQGKAKVEFRS